MAGMVIMSTINQVEALRHYLIRENGPMGSSNYASLTDLHLYQQNEDYHRLADDQKPVAYQIYKSMHDPKIYNPDMLGEDPSEYLNIYEIAYMLIIWGCIGLLTLVNMVIAVFEGARIYRSQRRYHDDQLIDHLLQT